MLKFIGCGSAFNTSLGNNSAYYKKASSILIIDCGGNIFTRIIQGKLLDNISNIYVLITHPHPDHVASVGDLIFYAHFTLKIKVTVLTPDTGNIQSLLSLMGVSGDYYEILGVDGKYVLQDKNFKICIMPFETAHAEGINSYGYMLEVEGRRVYYSGDSRHISGEILEMLEKGDVDLIYQDTSSFDFEQNPHMSFKKLCSAVKPELRNRVYCMHLDEVFDTANAKEQGFKIVANERD